MPDAHIIPGTLQVKLRTRRTHLKAHTASRGRVVTALEADVPNRYAYLVLALAFVACVGSLFVSGSAFSS